MAFPKQVQSMIMRRWLPRTIVFVMILLLQDETVKRAAAAFAPPAFHRQSHVSITADSPLHLSSPSSSSRLYAKPMRLKENVDGVVYVNDKCINCAACSGFAPKTFRRSDSAMAHVVYQQPSLTNAEELQEARSALAACPVAAIRIETLAERRHAASTDDAKRAIEQGWTNDDEELVHKMALKQSKQEQEDTASNPSHPLFPRPFLDDMEDVHWLGHHNDKSFGAIPYLLRTTLDGETVWIMIDTPRFSKSAREAVESLTGPSGPDYLFLTHVDDTADHGKWASHYSSGGSDQNSSNKKHLKRIFNAGDLGPHNWLGDLSLEKVEVLLQPPQEEQNTDRLTAYNLNGDVLPSDWMETMTTTSSDEEVVILHTPGHSPGSMTLYRRPSSYANKNNKPGILFTGDTYAWTNRGDGGYMSGFPRYGNNLALQAETLEKLLDLDWQVVAPGHGHPRDYRNTSIASSKEQWKEQREDELRGAQKELRTFKQSARAW